MSTSRISLAAFGLAIVAVLTASVVVIGSASADQTSVETIEIAEDGNRFLFDDAPVFDDGMPAGGNAFVTQGYIYEPGTLADGGGVNPDGSPTHPEAVIGTWTCEGFLIGDGAHAESGAWVVTTQIFDFEDFDGQDTVVTHGIELADIGVEVNRAIVGGTGEHAGASGVQSQTLEGFNDSMGVNLTVTLHEEG